MSARFEAIKGEASVVTLDGYHHVHLSDAAAVAAVVTEFLQRQVQVQADSVPAARSKL
jgi:hypothetical protein